MMNMAPARIATLCEVVDIYVPQEQSHDRPE